MLQWLDNFQQYGTNSSLMLNGPYAQIYTSAGGGATPSIVVDPDPTAGGTTVLKVPDGQIVNTGSNAPWGGAVRKVVPTPVASIGVMYRLWLDHLPSDSSHRPLVALTDTANTNQLEIIVTAVGIVQVYRGSVDTGTLLGESAIAVVANAWQHFEIKVVIGAAGSVEIRVESITILNLAGVNTQGGLTTVGNVILAHAATTAATSGTAYYKDFAIWDTTGSLNNSFLGTCFVYSMRPDSDVSGTWSITGGAGSGWASINETNPDDDTKYVSSPWPAATADVFTVTDLPTDATTVKGMMSMVRSRKSDGGDGQLQVSLVSGSSTGNGSNRPITTAYTYWTDIFETDPATAAAWTVAAANAVKLKLDRTL